MGDGEVTQKVGRKAQKSREKTGKSREKMLPLRTGGLG